MTTPMDAESTGRFAVLEDRVERLRDDVREHSGEDTKRFDKLESKVDGLSTKVVALTTTAALLGSALGHLLFGGHP